MNQSLERLQFEKRLEEGSVWYSTAVAAGKSKNSGEINIWHVLLLVILKLNTSQNFVLQA
jgi:hypothetical protein